MENKPVILELFSDETEAVVVKGFLETCGIATYVFNDNPFPRIVRGSATADFAPVKLMVNSSEFKKAQELLRRKKDEKDY
ncbi:MAG: DUF2007 domain-containing protein [Candidatus Ratteibacteria bacterium]|jgi:hypothetical protein